MRLLLIRHAEPDYEHDSLTEKGWKEAELLSKRLLNTKIDYFYCSPLGRAKDTASFTLRGYGKDAVEGDWLQEFPARINRPDCTDHKMIAWDWLPEDWTARKAFLDKDEWKNEPEMLGGEVGKMYDYAVEHLDRMLAEHGYVREGNYYRAVQPNDDTIALFCHFGISCVFLSHLLNVSPMVLWHGIVTLPSSVTVINTEERREGIAYFRASMIGDVSHLYMEGEEPSFAARFCECYSNTEERHD